MRNLTGPIPVWPDETVTVGLSYVQLQRIAVAKALALKNTDFKLDAVLATMSTDINATFADIEKEFEDHKEAIGKLHGEDQVNTGTCYINNYPVATQRQMSEGETYEAYVVPSLIGYVYPTVRRNHRDDLMGIGFTERSCINRATLLGLNHNPATYTRHENTLKKTQVIHYEGRLAHLVNGTNKVVSGVMTDPVTMLDVSQLVSIAPANNVIAEIGHASLSTKTYIDDKPYFYVSNPSWISVNPIIGMWSGDKLVPVDDRYKLLVVGNNEVGVLVDLTIDNTSMKLTTAVKNIQEKDERIGLFDGDTWTVNYEGPNGIVPNGEVTWASLFSSTVKPITVLGKPNLAYEWKTEDELAYLYFETKATLMGKERIFRLHLELHFDAQTLTMTVRWPKKYHRIVHDEVDIVGNAGWIHPKLNDEDPFNVEYDCGAFVRGVGHSSSVSINGRVIVRYFHHDKDTLVKFVDALPSLPEVTEVYHGTGSVSNAAQLPGAKRVFFLNNLSHVIMLEGSDGRKELVRSGYSTNSSRLTELEHFGIDVSVPMGVVNEIPTSPTAIREMTTNVWGEFNGFGSGGRIQFSKDGTFEAEDIPLNFTWVENTTKFVQDNFPESRWLMVGLQQLEKPAVLLLVSTPDGKLTIFTTLMQSTPTSFTGGSWTKAGEVQQTFFNRNKSLPEFVDVYATMIPGGALNVVVVNGYQYADSYLTLKVGRDASVTTPVLTEIRRVFGIPYRDSVIRVESNVTVELENRQYFNPTIWSGGAELPVPTDHSVMIDGLPCVVAKGSSFKWDGAWAKAYFYYRKQGRAATPFTSSVKLTDVQLKETKSVYYGLFDKNPAPSGHFELV